MSCQIIKWPSSPTALIFHPRILLYHCIPVSNVIYVWILKWSFPSSICHIDMKVILEILSHKLLHCTTKKIDYFIGRVQFSSVAQSCLSLCSTPCFPVHHQLPEFTQTHVYWVSDAIQPSHPLSSPSPPARKAFPASGSFPMSQLLASGGQSNGVSASVSVLPRNTQDWSPLRGTGWISLQSKGLSRVFSSTAVQKHQFFGAQLSL